jgi:hypothetical protein
MNMKLFTKKRTIVGLVAVAAMAALAFGAFGYFTTSGDGTGSATVGTSSPFVVNSSPAVGNALVPTAVGDANQVVDTVAYEVKNEQEGNQFLHTVTVKVDPAFDIPGTGGNPDCTAADFSLNGSATTGNTVTDTWNVNLKSVTDSPANLQDGSVTIQMVESNANQDACKGATVPLLFHAS